MFLSLDFMTYVFEDRTFTCLCMNCLCGVQFTSSKFFHIAQVCFWVEREILKEESVRLRAEVVTYFIKIAKVQCILTHYASLHTLLYN